MTDFSSPSSHLKTLLLSSVRSPLPKRAHENNCVRPDDSEQSHEVFVGTVSDEEAELKRGDTGYTGHREMFLSKEHPIQTKHFHRLVWVTERAYFDDAWKCSMQPSSCSVFSLSAYHMTQIQQFNYVSLWMFYCIAFKHAAASRCFFRVAIICSLGWSVLSDSLYFQSDNIALFPLFRVRR